jgi:hypothetical protein
VPPAKPAPRPFSPERFAARLRRFDGVLAVVVVALAFVLASFPAYNSDFLLHLASGRLIAHGEYPFGSDPFSYTAEEVSWVNNLTGEHVVWVNHSWLFDLIVYGLYTAIPSIGGAVVVVVKAVLIALLAIVLLQASRRPGDRLWLASACTLLALVVLSPRLYLQPVCVSYLFLGVTFWLLDRPFQGRSPRSWWWLPPLFLLWVNLDQWFLLGPLTVGLYLVGALLERQLARPASLGPARSVPVGRLALVLLAGLAACLVNPFHLHAFTLPGQLGFSEAAESLQDVNYFRSLFISPFGFQDLYFNPRHGLSPAGMSYFPLLLLGILSFVLTWESLSLRRLLLWTALALLSAWHARAIPFFAVVAGPISALNFADFASRRFGSAMVTEGGWRRWSISGRALTVFLGLILVAVSVPGLLQAQPYQLRRFGWRVEIDTGLQHAAEQLADWDRKGWLPDNWHYFNIMPDILPYIAWFGDSSPRLRGFIDHRIALYPRAASEYVAFGRNDPSWREAMQRRQVRLLIFHETNLFRSRPTQLLALGFFRDSQQLKTLFIEGGTVIFGWDYPENRTQGASPFARLQLDSDQLAFGPGAAPAPSSPPEPTISWWQLLFPPDGPKSVDARSAMMYLFHYNGLTGAYRERHLLEWQGQALHNLAACASLSANPAQLAMPMGMHLAALGLVGDPTALEGRGDPRSFTRVNHEMSQAILSTRDSGPTGSLYLGVRAARRALAAGEDAETYQLLGQLYWDLSKQPRERRQGGELFPLALVRRTQTLAPLVRAVQLDPDLEVAHDLLHRAYSDMGFLDLFVHHYAEWVRITESKGPSLGETRQGFEERLARSQAQLKQMQRVLQERTDEYTVRASTSAPLEQVALAMARPNPKTPKEFGLAEKIVEAVRRMKEPDLVGQQGRPPGLRILIELLFNLGRLEDVRVVLKPECREFLGIDPEVGLPAYEWFQYRLAVASGQVDKARAALRELRVAAARPHQIAAPFRVCQLLLLEASQSQGRVLAIDLVNKLSTKDKLHGEAVNHCREWKRVEAELDVLGGWLFLDTGQLEEARELFHRALEVNQHPERWVPFLMLGMVGPMEKLALAKVAVLRQQEPFVAFGGRSLAVLGLSWLDAHAAPK